MIYIVGTPIGNIKDISLRGVEILTNSDVILTEDTRTFNHFYNGVQELYNVFPTKKQSILAYYKEIEFEKLSFVISLIKEGKDISLVSESGLPTISDPGHVLVKYLINTMTPFTIIPGPTAFVSAAILSGFPTNQILFLGFLPKKKSAIVQMFEHIDVSISKFFNPTIVFYESPNRINRTLDIISEIIPCAEIAVCREMTKRYQEVIRGKPKDLLGGKYKGEITVVLTIDR